ncbi:MAG: arginine--tRNA ligase [Ignavibacteria bacterium]
MISYLKEKINSALSKINIQSSNPTFERPKDEKFGDLSTNIAMIIAKEQNSNPKEIAKQIIDNLELSEDVVSKVEIAGAGFINLYFSEKYLTDNLKSILKLKTEYGRLDVNKNKTANIEWVSANPTGPLHAGHGRHIALGKAIANLLEWSGYKLTREYYYNNAGRQMDSLAKSVFARYMQFYEPDYKLPEDAYTGEYIIEIAGSIKQEYEDKLLNSVNDLSIFRTAGENWCFKSIRHTLDRMGISHDVFSNEDTLYKDGKVKNILADFKSRDLSYEKDGAVWLKTSELLKSIKDNKKDSEDKVIVKSSGEPTYRLPDMAYHIDKIKRGYELIVDIFGSDHADTYKEVIAGVGALGYDTSKIKVILHQMVTFVQDGKPVRMSKRSDNVYYLDDLLDDVGADVAQFFFVMRSANTHLDFDVNLAKEQSEKNPVFYLQYAHARICGILRNAESITDYILQITGFKPKLIQGDDEVKVMRKLAFFPYTVESAYSTLEPHKIIIYLNELAEVFHKFYHNNRVINPDDKELTAARLALCKAAKITLANGFDIIGIRAPERM